jgi:hypothetical protein
MFPIKYSNGAYSGETGREFAVVADEVAGLASRTSHNERFSSILLKI